MRVHTQQNNKADIQPMGVLACNLFVRACLATLIRSRLRACTRERRHVTQGMDYCNRLFIQKTESLQVVASMRWKELLSREM